MPFSCAFEMINNSILLMNAEMRFWFLYLFPLLFISFFLLSFIYFLSSYQKRKENSILALCNKVMGLSVSKQHENSMKTAWAGFTKEMSL